MDIFKTWARGAAAGVCVLALATASQAALIQGDYLGTFNFGMGGTANNDTVAQAIEEAFMLPDDSVIVDQLAKVDTPATSNDGLEISNITNNGDGEPISGDWTYTPDPQNPMEVAFLAVKSGPNFALYDYRDADMKNMGIWDTSGVDDKGLSNISVYKLIQIPEPASLALLSLGGLTLLRRRA